MGKSQIERRSAVQQEKPKTKRGGPKTKKHKNSRETKGESKKNLGDCLGGLGQKLMIKGGAKRAGKCSKARGKFR